MTERIRELLAMDEGDFVHTMMTVFGRDFTNKWTTNNWGNWAFRARDMACKTVTGAEAFDVAMLDIYRVVPHQSKEMGLGWWSKYYAQPKHWVCAAIVALEGR